MLMNYHEKLSLLRAEIKTELHIKSYVTKQKKKLTINSIYSLPYCA